MPTKIDPFPELSDAGTPNLDRKPDQEAVIPETAAAAGPNLDFDMMKRQAQELGGEWHETERHFVVHIPGRDRLAFSFDNLSSMSVPGPRKPWAFDLIRAQGWGSLGVMVKRNDWFRSDQLFDVLEDMRDNGVYSSYPAVSMYGASMGAFGATAFAPLAPGCTVLAFAPQSTLNRHLAPFEKRYRPARRRYDWTNPRYRDGAEGIRAAGKAYLIYDNTIPMDLAHAKRLDGPNVINLDWPFLTHKIPPRLNRMKILKPLALAGLDGSLDREKFCAMLRSRRDCNVYLVDMIAAAGEKGHDKLARAAIDKVLQTSSNWKARQLSRHLNRLSKAGTAG